MHGEAGRSGGKMQVCGMARDLEQDKAERFLMLTSAEWMDAKWAPSRTQTASASFHLFFPIIL